MSSNTRSVDLLVIGSGAGGLTACLAARARGADVLLVEKETLIGGNSALSGGTMWIPGNPLMKRDGIDDSVEAGLEYLNACVPDDGDPLSQARKKAYLDEGIRLVDFLEKSGIPFNRVDNFADYYAELPGSTTRGRALQVDFFALKELGEYKDLVPNLAPILGYVQEIPKLALMRRTWLGFQSFIKVALRTARRRLFDPSLSANGSALVGRLLHACLESGVDIWRNCPVEQIIERDGRVCGAIVRKDGLEYKIETDKILVACGGYARNLEMRKSLSKKPASTDWTFSNPGETGEVVQMAMSLGAAIDLADEAIWIPAAFPPGGQMYLEYERGKPFSLIVDGKAQRYIDEGTPYMRFGQVMFENNKMSPAIPSWFIFDSRHRSYYTFGMCLPGCTPEEWFSSGFMKRADTVHELAALCDLDAEALTQTINLFNQHASTGVDTEFNRGETLYSRNMGDPRNQPNPALGSVEKPPFYAVAIYPGDLGTFGGLKTNANAQVLREDGEYIRGLYATGNATAPVMGRNYPCTGASIASSMIFGFIAAQHAFGRVTNI